MKSEASFEVYRYEDHPFKNYSYEDIVRLLGVKDMPEGEIPSLPLGPINEELPENFVASEKWPDCVHEIRNQGSCGSCWAFGASETLSDRFCVASQGKVNVILSPQDMVSCDRGNSGCNGGNIDLAWEYLRDTGIVSDECYPYSSGGGSTGQCRLTDDKCPSGTGVVKKYRAKDYTHFNTVNDMKNDIYHNGPVESRFQVYADFLSYKGGIYKKTSSKFLGGHAIKVIGWGVEQGTEYWVVANSWGPAWGEKGYFRFAINNCCGFEEGNRAGTPKLDADFFLGN